MEQIEVLQLKFTLQDLSQLEEEERVFFIQLGGILQEVISLQKYAYILSRKTENFLERSAKNSEAMYFCRLLAATLFEGWRTVTGDRYRVVLGKIRLDFDDAAKKEFGNLETYFSKSNNICEKVRNNYAFHYNYGAIRGILRSWSAQDTFDILVSDYHFNCRYLASDVATNCSIFGAKSPEEGANRFMSEILDIAKAFQDMAGECLVHIIGRISGGVRNTHVLHNVPCLHEATLNYFMTDR